MRTTIIICSLLLCGTITPSDSTTQKKNWTLYNNAPHLRQETHKALSTIDTRLQKLIRLEYQVRQHNNQENKNSIVASCQSTCQEIRKAINQLLEKISVYRIENYLTDMKHNLNTIERCLGIQNVNTSLRELHSQFIEMCQTSLIELPHHIESISQHCLSCMRNIGEQAEDWKIAQAQRSLVQFQLMYLQFLNDYNIQDSGLRRKIREIPTKDILHNKENITATLREIYQNDILRYTNKAPQNDNPFFDWLSSLKDYFWNKRPPIHWMNLINLEHKDNTNHTLDIARNTLASINNMEPATRLGFFKGIEHISNEVSQPQHLLSQELQDNQIFQYATYGAGMLSKIEQYVPFLQTVQSGISGCQYAYNTYHNFWKLPQQSQTPTKNTNQSIAHMIRTYNSLLTQANQTKDDDLLKRIKNKYRNTIIPDEHSTDLETIAQRIDEEDRILASHLDDTSTKTSEKQIALQSLRRELYNALQLHTNKHMTQAIGEYCSQKQIDRANNLLDRIKTEYRNTIIPDEHSTDLETIAQRVNEKDRIIASNPDDASPETKEKREALRRLRFELNTSPRLNCHKSHLDLYDTTLQPLLDISQRVEQNPTRTYRTPSHEQQEQYAHKLSHFCINNGKRLLSQFLHPQKSLASRLSQSCINNGKKLLPPLASIASFKRKLHAEACKREQLQELPD